MNIWILNSFIGIYISGVVVLSLINMDEWMKRPKMLFYILTFPIQVFRKNGCKILFNNKK